MYPDDLANLYQAGDTIAGRYSIVKVLGAGGMGVVLAARHQDLDTLVAIKLLRPEMVSNRDVVARFAAEARAAVRIKSEHVARVTDVNVLPDGAPYMVMEYLEGSDLAQLVEQRGPLPIDDAVDYVLQACEALTEAHGLGIVHRDLKPGNLFLSLRADGSEVIKVLDFGISKSLDSGAGAAGASLTATGAMLGSPTYMSPEQLSDSKAVDRRTDIWAIGVILHQLLSGALPFQADTLPELFMAIVQNQPPPLRVVRSDVPPGLAAIVLRCLHKDRTQRFDSVGELAAALIPFSPQRSRISIDRILRMTPVATTKTAATEQTATQMDAGPTWQLQGKPAGSDTQRTWGQTAAPSRSAPQRLLVGLGALLLLAGAGVALRARLWPSHSAVAPASASASPDVSAAPAAPQLARAPVEVPVEPPHAEPAAPPPPRVAGVANVADITNVADVAPTASPRTQAPSALPRATVAAQGRSPTRTPNRPAEASAAVARPTEPPSSTPLQTPTPAAPRVAASAAPPTKPHNDWEEDRR